MAPVQRSVVKYLMGLQKPNVLSKLLLNVTEVIQVTEIPRKYDGNVAMEFPPTIGMCKAMDSMEGKYDPHIWIKS